MIQEGSSSYLNKIDRVYQYISKHLNEALNVEIVNFDTIKIAVLEHKGSPAQLNNSISLLYGQWLPQSEQTLRDFPCFFHYVNLFPQVAEHQLITDIYLPLT